MDSGNVILESTPGVRPWLDRPSVQWLVPIVVTTALLGACAAYGMARFGSITAALSYAGGQRILVDTALKSLGNVAPGSSSTLKFTLRNLTDHSVTIQGAQSSCTCAIVNDVPCVIEPRGSKTLDLKVTTPAGRKEIMGQISVYTDDADTSVIVLGYKGRVVVSEAVGTGRGVPG